MVVGMSIVISIKHGIECDLGFRCTTTADFFPFSPSLFKSSDLMIVARNTIRWKIRRKKRIKESFFYLWQMATVFEICVWVCVFFGKVCMPTVSNLVKRGKKI